MYTYSFNVSEKNERVSEKREQERAREISPPLLHTVEYKNIFSVFIYIAFGVASVAVNTCSSYYVLSPF